MNKIVRLLGISWCFICLLGIMACTTDNETWNDSDNGEYLSLCLQVSGESKATVRATEAGEEAQNENMVTTADVFIFEDGGNTLVHYQRLSNNNNNSGSTLAGSEQPLSLRKKDVKGKTLDIYVIANYPDVDLASISTLDALKAKSFKQDFICNLTPNNEENFFLMDGKALNVTDLDTSTPTITLKRAAAKIRIKIEAEIDKISYTSVDGKTYDDATIAISSTANLSKKIVNYTSATFLLADAGLLDAEERSFKSSDKYVEFADNTALLYSYANSWNSDDSATGSELQPETYVLLNIPVVVTYIDDSGMQVNETIYPNYYRVPLGDRNGGSLERNHLYDIKAVVNALGSGVENEPVTLDSRLEVQGWGTETINVGSDDAEYLEVNKTELLLNNIEEDNSIEFFSSSPITDVKVSNVTYTDKYGVTKTITEGGTDYPDGSTYYPTVDKPTTLTGTLQLHSTQLINVPKFFTITITNESGSSKTIHVTQYPLEYITSTQGWYSTRDDLASLEESKNNGETVYNISTGEDENRIVYFNFGAKYVKSVNDDGKSTIYKYNYTENNGKYILTDGSLQSSDNARIYHVQITAASSVYRIGYPQMDENGYTAEGDDNAKLVSPSFMIASQLGTTDKTGPEGTEIADIEKEVKEHCKKYIEVEVSSTKKVVYDDWRLPTPAELDIIAKFQKEDNSAVNEILVSKEYWSSNGKHQVRDDENASEGTRIRCVRDVKPEQ